MIIRKCLLTLFLLSIIQSVLSVGDFDSALAGGRRGLPGARIRVNRPAFEYANTLIGPLLTSQISKARIPPVQQCLPQGTGCLNIYNLFVSRFKMPEKISIHPAPPNRIVLFVKNVDIGVTGNLGGQVVLVSPIGLYGIVQANIFRTSIGVQLTIQRGPQGPYVGLAACHMQIGLADVYTEHAGLLGDFVNKNIRDKVSSKVRKMLPKQICAQLPKIIDEQINSKLRGMPQGIPVPKLLSMINGILGAKEGTPPIPGVPATGLGALTGSSQINLPQNSSPVAAPAPQAQWTPQIQARPMAPMAARPYQQGPPSRRQRRHFTHYQFAPVQQQPINVYYMNPASFIPPQWNQGGAMGGRFGTAPVSNLGAWPRYPPPPPVQAGNVANPNCPPRSGLRIKRADEEQSAMIKLIASKLDLSKLNDLYFDIGLMNTVATRNDITVDLAAEFNQNGSPGAPFGPFPMNFPTAQGNRMVEILLSDFTLNSLLYQLHRKQFISIRIDSTFPKIGELLKTSCSGDDDFDDDEVELDEEETTVATSEKKSEEKTSDEKAETSADSETETTTADASDEGTKKKKKRNNRAVMKIKTKRRRREDEAGFADLGVCVGDILPAISEKYPNKKLAILVHTTSAPSIVFSSAKNGQAKLHLQADADVTIDETNEKVGTIKIDTIIAFNAQIKNNKIVGTVEIEKLHLEDPIEALGLPQDALDNLSNIGKETLQKYATDALQKGLDIKIPDNLPIPITIHNPEVRIVDHAVYIGSDLGISPALLC